MGVQSLDADELLFLDRLHSAERAEAALGEIRDAGFDNVNLDLIYGLPHQPIESWRNTLNRVVSWRPEHLSCYALTVEDGTPLASSRRGGRRDRSRPRPRRRNLQLDRRTPRRGRLRALRDQQLRAPGPRVPAQPQLLAPRRLHRRRTGRTRLLRRSALQRHPPPRRLRPRPDNPDQIRTRLTKPRHRLRRDDHPHRRGRRHPDPRSPPHPGRR